MAVKWQSESMKVDTTIENIDCVARLGSRKGQRPILIKFTSFPKYLEVLKNKRNLGGFKVRVDEDHSVKARRLWKELVPCLKDARSGATN
jgi:hypothetical protein